MYPRHKVINQGLVTAPDETKHIYVHCSNFTNFDYEHLTNRKALK